MCFTCGDENPRGIGAKWFLIDDGTITTEMALSSHQQGPPDHAHGGALAALLDEAMGFSVWAAGYRVLAVNLNVDFKRMVPLDQVVSITARVTGKDGRKVFAEGEVRLGDGEVAVAGRGIYVEPRQEVFPDLPHI
jgi:uncharacterized protein (TIGR00369 family)